MTTVRWCHWPGTSMLEHRNLSDAGNEVGVQISGSIMSATTQREIYQKLKKKKKLHHFFCLFFTQVSECLLLCGDDQTAIIGWEGDRQADILLFGAGHVANHRQQTDRVRITGWAEPVDLEPAGKRETSCGGESSAVCGWQPHDWTCTYRINQQMCQYQTQHSPPPIPPVEMESAVTPLTVASVGRKRQLHSTVRNQ